MARLKKQTPKKGETVVVDGVPLEVIDSLSGVGFVVGYPRRIILIDESLVEWEVLNQLEND